EAELGVDAEHLRVRVGISGADVLGVRPLAHDPVEHHGLHPETEPVAAMAARHRGALLPDDPWLLRVVGDVGEAGPLAGRLVDRDEQPPLDAGLLEPRFAVPDLLLSELPVAHL